MADLYNKFLQNVSQFDKRVQRILGNEDAYGRATSPVPPIDYVNLQPHVSSRAGFSQQINAPENILSGPTNTQAITSGQNSNVGTIPDYCKLQGEALKKRIYENAGKGIRNSPENLMRPGCK